jgi:nitroreductase
MLDQPQRLKLRKPRDDGDVSLERCVRQRRSVRSFRARGLTTDELGQLLWAAQGITAADGRRSAPSAGALYPLALYAVIGQVSAMVPGAYRYFPDIHEMVLVAPGFRREKLAEAARGQGWIATAAMRHSGVSGDHLEIRRPRACLRLHRSRPRRAEHHAAGGRTWSGSDDGGRI